VYIVLLAVVSLWRYWGGAWRSMSVVKEEAASRGA